VQRIALWKRIQRHDSWASNARSRKIDHVYRQLRAETGNHRRVIAVDVGGTSVKAHVVAADGSVVRAVREPTRRLRGVAEVIQIADLITRLADGSGACGVGVATPGVVDDDSGVVRAAVNLGWTDVPLRDLLAARTGLPTIVRHDARTGGLAEFTRGAAAGVANAMFVPIGTGIGAAVRVDGRCVSAGGYLGEIGHIVVDPSGSRCPCGARGCLETVATGPALVRRYARRTGVTADALKVVELMIDGDRDAAQVWGEAVSALATALATTVTLLGTETVVLGGGLAEAGDTLVVPLREALASQLTFQRRPSVVRAMFGQDATIAGAAELGWLASRTQ
jgi:glucokinase